MKVTFQDRATGETACIDGISQRRLLLGNYSCDCNRGRPFGVPSPAIKCAGHNRFIVIDVEAEPGDVIVDKNRLIELSNKDYYPLKDDLK